MIRNRRAYIAPQQQGPHTTYFQAPPTKPPRRLLWRFLKGTALLGLGTVIGGSLVLTSLKMKSIDLVASLDDVPEDEAAQLHTAIIAGMQDAAARNAPPLDHEHATEYLKVRAGYSVTPKAVSHFTQAPSNLPCEDTMGSGTYNFLGDPAKDWSEWGIFDGHAGSRTAQLLKDTLPIVLGEALNAARCMVKPVEDEVVRTIKAAFLKVDKEIVEATGELIKKGGSLPEIVTAGAAAFSGSCALVAIYDPVREVLRVANVGDSRCVLGRWDSTSQKYVAYPLSVDQTGFNQNEVDRLARDHPGEDVVDPKSGRVHGIAISRAFGDARWKWPEALTQLAADNYWGFAPRPNGVIKTPPYLTAEPDVVTCKIQTGDRPDFLIMASDGLWDQLSSENAVHCVQIWLDKYKPTEFLEAMDSVEDPKNPLSFGGKKRTPPTFTSAADLADDDTWYDEDEKCMKWRNEPKHFVVEDDNCGVHLVKNALGGKRRDLFAGVMSVQPPFSRKVRDDITVNVIFFGVDVSMKALEAKSSAGVMFK